MGLLRTSKDSYDALFSIVLGFKFQQDLVMAYALSDIPVVKNSVFLLLQPLPLPCILKNLGGQRWQ